MLNTENYQNVPFLTNIYINCYFDKYLFYLCYKTSYLFEEVNHTEPSPSVRIHYLRQ